MSIACQPIDRNDLEAVSAALLTEVVRNSQAHALTQTRNLGVTNLVWSFHRLNRLDDVRHPCGVACASNVSAPDR